MQRVVAHARSPQVGVGAEKRRETRTQVGLKGKLFVPQRNCEDECTVIDFSTDGAGLKCVGSAPIGTRVVLYVECFGRFDGVVAQRDRVRLGIEFQSSKVKRERTRAQLADYVAHGMTAHTPLRNAARAREVPPLNHFIAEDGRRIDCELVDVALGGASLRTNARPAIGKILGFGMTAGRVVRHTDEGIAVEFIGRRADDRQT